MPKNQWFTILFRRARKSLSRSQWDFAVRSGININTVRNWEQGRTSPEIENIGRLIRFLGHEAQPLLQRLGVSPTGEREYPEHEQLHVALDVIMESSSEALKERAAEFLEGAAHKAAYLLKSSPTPQRQKPRAVGKSQEPK